MFSSFCTLPRPPHGTWLLRSTPLHHKYGSAHGIYADSDVPSLLCMATLLSILERKHYYAMQAYIPCQGHQHLDNVESSHPDVTCRTFDLGVRPTMKHLVWECSGFEGVHACASSAHA